MFHNYRINVIWKLSFGKEILQTIPNTIGNSSLTKKLQKYVDTRKMSHSYTFFFRCNAGIRITSRLNVFSSMVQINIQVK